jgi:hypothetical protein
MKRRRQESGFALLLVFLMAAVISITLYMELPRVAFDTQRQKEQLLIERGEQYKIAIRRFLQANKNRWPASMDELESFNNRRFLRRRFKDPMTGKDEWRIVHIQNGILTDSKNSKPKTDQTKNSTPNTFIQEMAGLGSVGAPQPGRNPATMGRRPSDANAGTLPGGGTGGAPDPNNPGNNPNGNNPNGNNSNNLPPQPFGSGQPGIPGQPYPAAGVLPPGVPAMPGAGANQPSSGFIANQPGLGSVSQPGGVTVGPNGQPIYPGQPTYPGQQPYPGAPGMPVNSQTGGVSPYPVGAGANGGAPVYGQPGTNAGQQNAAVGLINGILTSPRPGGMNGIQPIGGQPIGGGPQGGQFNQTNGTQMGGTLSGPGGGIGGSTPGTPIGSPIGSGGTIGGGIAGVASNDDADSIMVYADHTNYSEWEFIFDPTKWHAPPNPNQGTIGTSAASLGTSPQNMNGPGGGTPGVAIGTPIGGGTSPFGGQQPGGQQPGGQLPGGTGQTGTTGMGGASQFGGGGLPDIRPGRR